MLSSENFHEKVKEALEKVELCKEPIELYQPISYALSIGGKRIRPALVMLSCNMFGGRAEDAVNPAIAIEIFHNFTLLHDDIMDHAPLRRGKETVYKKWNSNVAILSGDTMFALAYKHLIKTETRLLPELLEIFTATAIEVCEGQQYDMNYETRKRVTIGEYIEMIRLKTAVLIAASLKTGALIGGAGKCDLDHIYKFGECVGLAFQLQDDLLDTFGDQEKFGKKIGGDIETNKKTYLCIKAFLDARGNDKKLLEHYFSSLDFDPEEKVRKVKDVYEKTGVKKATVDLINQYYEKALEHYNLLTISVEKKEVLRNFTDQMMQREY